MYWENKWEMRVIGNMASMRPTSILHIIKIDGDPWGLLHMQFVHV